MHQSVGPAASGHSSVPGAQGLRGEGRLQIAGLPADRGSQHKFWSREGRDQSVSRQAGAHQRKASALHQHRFRDGFQTSSGLPGLTGTHKKAKGLGSEAGRGRPRARGCAGLARALPVAPARAWTRLGRRSHEEDIGSLSSFFPSRITEATVWRDLEALDFQAQGGGGPGSLCSSKKN